LPTDHSVIRWSCDLCGSHWTGPGSKHTAEACEATGAPEPLPDGTWVLMNGYAANWDELTTGGFRLMRIDGHEIRNTHWMSTTPATDPQQHIVRYGGGGRELTSESMHPHLPGVLNLSDISRPAHHDDRINTLLRDPAVAVEFSDMLATFGVTLDPEYLAELADDVYRDLEFGWHTDERPNSAKALPPLASLSLEMQAAIRAVAIPKSPAIERPWDRITPAMEVKHQYRECSGNIAQATARLLTGFGESLEARAARWWAGEDVDLLAGMLTWHGGIRTKGGNSTLTVEQRDAMRAAGFKV
jgi:hypothetical protein